MLLQLHEEGKLDLQKPVLDYLPWLPIVTSYGAVSAHHLLTHTSGLPDALTLIPSDRSTRYAQAWKPGERFYYSNLGFDILGNLIEVLDGRTWPASVKARVLGAVGMRATSPVITDDIREQTAESWVPYFEDRPYPRYGRLAPAANLQFDDAAGSIASTPADMVLYIQMLLNRGQASSARIVSPDSFALMTKPWIKASAFGPDASYRYGIAVETVDGHTILRHTGGMPSFMSAIHLDLDAGVGAFASINAQQNYRPTPVALYAVQLMRASVAGKPSPAAPVIEDPKAVKNSADYVGAYFSPDGKTVEITGEGTKYSGPRTFSVSPEYTSLTGTYRGTGPFESAIANIVILKGELWAEGQSALERIGEFEFRPTEDAPSPERVEFLFIVNGKAAC